MSESQARGGANVEFRQVGRSLARIDAPGKTHGKTRYAGDYVMPGMLHVKVLRSPEASALLTRIDVSRARALAGVACVLTHAELPDRLAPTDIPGQTGRKRLDTDQQILVRERVRYHGEPLALVAAETPAIAERALELIAFDLAPFPGVYSVEGALAPGAPVVQGTDNVVSTYKVRKGDVEAGFAAADTIEAYILELLDAKINMFELVIGEMDTILGNLDEPKGFEEIIFDLWVSSRSDAEFSAEMDGFGEKLLAARESYLRQKAYDEALFGDHFIAKA